MRMPGFAIWQERHKALLPQCLTALDLLKSQDLPHKPTTSYLQKNAPHKTCNQQLATGNPLIFFRFRGCFLRGFLFFRGTQQSGRAVDLFLVPLRFHPRHQLGMHLGLDFFEFGVARQIMGLPRIVLDIV